jgi:hypothetical protein
VASPPTPKDTNAPNDGSSLTSTTVATPGVAIGCTATWMTPPCSVSGVPLLGVLHHERHLGVAAGADSVVPSDRDDLAA